MRVQLSQHWFICDGLAPDTRQAITRIKAEQDVWRYISSNWNGPQLNELSDGQSSRQHKYDSLFF